MKKPGVITLIYCLIFVFVLVNCVGLPKGGLNRSNKPYEEYLVTEGIIQYFVKPLYLKADKTKFSMDFTLRSNVKSDSLIICNFSVISKTPIEKIEKITFELQNDNFGLYESKKLFFEKQDKVYHLRYTTKMKFEDFVEFVNSSSFNIIINDIKFEPKKSVFKTLIRVNTGVVQQINSKQDN